MQLAVDTVVVRHAVLMLVAIAGAFTLHPAVLTWTGLAIFGLRIVAQADAWRPRGFGSANGVTVLRLVLAAAIGLIPAAWAPIVTPLTIGIFVLDGIDGWLARRFGLASAFGAALDMETDAYLIAILSACLWQHGIAGVWIVLPAVLRYVHVLAVLIVGHDVETPRSRLSRYAFSVLVCSLGAAFLPFPRFAVFAALLGTVTVCTSFGQSFWLLFTGAGPRPPAETPA